MKIAPFVVLLVSAGAQAQAGPWELHTISTSAYAAQSVVAADVDGDGDQDVFSMSVPGEIAWHENLGGNPVRWQAHSILTGGTARSIHAADLDRDGDVDALVALSPSDRIAWYENLGGSPIAWAAHDISTLVSSVGAVFAADVDGDGDLDALSASALDDKIAWYENGAGIPWFWPAHTITTNADGANAVFAADIDGDGDVDVLSSSGNDNRIAWHEHLGGTPPAWSMHIISTARQLPFSVFAADLDGDGDRDVVSASYSDDTIAWYENRGGLFQFEHIISRSADAAWAVFAADLDADGDIDVLSASDDDDKVAWYENGGGWREHIVSTATSHPRGVSVADVDGDGDLDVLSASDGDRIAWHENQALAARQVVRLGTPANPDALLPGWSSGPVIGATWDPWIDHATFMPGATVDALVIAPAPINVPFPGWGTVLVDVSGSVLVFTANAGRRFAVALPVQCCLLGTSLYSQGFSSDLSAVGLTNALDLTIGSY